MSRRSYIMVVLLTALALVSSGCGVVKVVDPEASGEEGRRARKYDFESGDDIVGVPNVRWFTTSEQFEYMADTEVVAPDSDRSIKMVWVSDGEHEYGDLTMSVPAAPFAGKTIRYRGRIKTEGVVGSLEDPDGCTHCEGNGATIQIIGWGVENLGERMINGSADWTDVEVSMRIPEQVDDRELLFSAVLFGKGTAWFDDLRVVVE